MVYGAAQFTQNALKQKLLFTKNRKPPQHGNQTAPEPLVHDRNYFSGLEILVEIFRSG